MKKFIAVFITLTSLTAFAADDRLVRRGLEDVQSARKGLRAFEKTHPDNDLRDISRDLKYAEDNLRDALRNDAPIPPAPPKTFGNYCAAACTTSDKSTPNLKQTQGGTGEFMQQARDAALAKTQAEFSCYYGAVVTECSPIYEENRFDAGSACTDSNGKLNIRQSASGQATSLVEAKVKASRATQQLYSCYYGVKDYISSSELRRTYCTAGCTDSEGKFNSRQSKGAEGRNKTEATMKAIADTQKTFSCYYGLTVLTCEEQ